MIYFHFMVCDLCVCVCVFYQQSLTSPKITKIFLLILSINYTVLSLNFFSMTPDEVSIGAWVWYEIGSEVHFLSYGNSIVSVTFIEKNLLSPLNYFVLFIDNYHISV